MEFKNFTDSLTDLYEGSYYSQRGKDLGYNTKLEGRELTDDEVVNLLAKINSLGITKTFIERILWPNKARALDKIIQRDLKSGKRAKIYPVEEEKLFSLLNDLESLVGKYKS